LGNVSDLVHLEIERGIATIILDSPHNRNALSQALLDQLAERLETGLGDDSVRGVVLTATGTTFCSGADLSGQTTDSSRGATLPEILTLIWDAPKAVIVELNGHVRAGGTGIVAAADIVVAPATATFAFTEVRIGVAPAMIAVVCVRRMTPRSLFRYCVTGEVFDAEAAREAGLVSIVVAPHEVRDATQSLVTAISGTEPKAVRATKELLHLLPGLPLGAGFAHASEVGAALFASPEAAEGMLAFREKRPPAWAL
jgi:methylglutaconyl-CoA hydratase